MRKDKSRENSELLSGCGICASVLGLVTGAK